MVTINLTGFDPSFPTQLKVAAKTYQEAIEMLKLHDKFNPIKQTKRFLCRVLECEDVAALKSRIVGTELNLVCDSEVNSTFQGSGEQKMQVVLGVVLVVVGIIVTIWNPSVGISMQVAGWSMIVGAIIQRLMMPDDNEDARQSRIVSRYPNTVASGTPKALILGKFRFGGHLISVNVESRDGVYLDLQGFVYNLWDPQLYLARDSWETLYQNSNTNTFGKLGRWDRGGNGGSARDETWITP